MIKVSITIFLQDKTLPWYLHNIVLFVIAALLYTLYFLMYLTPNFLKSCFILNLFVDLLNFPVCVLLPRYYKACVTFSNGFVFFFNLEN